MFAKIEYGPVISARARMANLSRRLRKDEEGVAAIEFAIVAMPFFMLVFGLMSVCFFYFTIVSVENGVWLAARDMRTGAFQLGLGQYNGLTGDNLKNKFRDHVCSKMPPHIQSDCTSKIRILVQATGNMAGLQPPDCSGGNAGGMISQTAANGQFDAAQQNEVTVVTACYPWSFAQHLPFFNVSSSLSDGSYLVQASATFRAEPYQ